MKRGKERLSIDGLSVFLDRWRMKNHWRRLRVMIYYVLYIVTLMWLPFDNDSIHDAPSSFSSRRILSPANIKFCLHAVKIRKKEELKPDIKLEKLQMHLIISVSKIVDSKFFDEGGMWWVWSYFFSCRSLQKFCREQWSVALRLPDFRRVAEGVFSLARGESLSYISRLHLPATIYRWRAGMVFWQCYLNCHRGALWRPGAEECQIFWDNLNYRRRDWVGIMGGYLGSIIVFPT